MIRRGRIAPSLFALCALVGCNGSGEDEEMPAPIATKAPFEGKADPSIVGTYKTTDGRSTYTFNKDGGFKLAGTISTQGGSFANNVDGSWAVNDKGEMLFKYGDGNVVPYRLVKEGDKLKLTLNGAMKRETVMIRQ